MQYGENDAVSEYDNDTFYFQYANPVETEQELSQQKRPRLWAGEPYESSPYYYFWLFLKENSDYLSTCNQAGEGLCSELYLDFGDVRSDHFMGWWRDRGRHLFCEPHSATAREIDRNRPKYGNPEFRLLIEIERYGDVDRTLAEIRKIIQEQRPENDPGQPLGDHGRAGRTVSRALYQCFTKPHLLSLRSRHEAYILLKREPNITHEKFVEKAKIKLNGLTAEKASQIYRDELAMIVKYAGKGVFPVMSEKQERRVDSYLRNRKRAAIDRRREVAQGLHCQPFGPPLSKLLEELEDRPVDYPWLGRPKSPAAS